MAHALEFARAHAGALGLTAARVAALGTPDRTTVSGIERLTWQRSFGGIPAFGDELRVALGPDGAVLSASGAAAQAAPPSLTPSLSAAQAMTVVSDDAGAGAPPRVVSGPSGARRTTTFAGGGRAQLVVHDSRLAWRVVYPALPSAVYDTIVDATTGAILRRANLFKSDAPADVWDVHPNDSAPRHLDLGQLGYLPAQATTLQNQWIHAFSAANATDFDPEAGQEEVSPPAGVPYAFTPFAVAGCTAALPCAWNPAQANSWRSNREQVAVQAFYLANRFREYLAAPSIGFDGFGNSVGRLDIATDWGAGFAADPDGAPADAFDNSGMFLGDSTVPWTMALSLFGVSYRDGGHGFRAIDAGDDASIVDHEYTHGFTNQTVVFSDGSSALFSPQAWAIDEASADFFAKSYLVDKGFETDTAAPGEIDMGDYTDTTPHVLRKEALDCPVHSSTVVCPRGGLTYADFGHIGGVREPHYNGEIWAETMWDLRRALPAGRATELAAKALAIVPPEPSFLDLRNAILTAARPDEAATIWQVFAQRGMGCDARTTGGDDTAPTAGFTPAPCPSVTPTPTPAPTVSPTATPVATPTAPPAPLPPSLTLQRSGRRAVKFTVTCRAACSVTGTLRVSRATAKRLHLGSRRTVGTLRAQLTAAGRRTFTVRLSAAAARALKRSGRQSFTATLTARAGATSQRRTVTVRR